MAKGPKIEAHPVVTRRETSERIANKRAFQDLFSQLRDCLVFSGDWKHFSKKEILCQDSLSWEGTLQGKKIWLLVWCFMDGDVPSLLSALTKESTVAQEVQAKKTIGIHCTSLEHHCSTNDPEVAAFFIRRVIAGVDP